MQQTKQQPLFSLAQVVATAGASGIPQIFDLRGNFVYQAMVVPESFFATCGVYRISDSIGSPT
jgi:hypothetical protein